MFTIHIARHFLLLHDKYVFYLRDEDWNCVKLNVLIEIFTDEHELGIFKNESCVFSAMSVCGYASYKFGRRNGKRTRKRVRGSSAWYHRMSRRLDYFSRIISWWDTGSSTEHSGTHGVLLRALLQTRSNSEDSNFEDVMTKRKEQWVEANGIFHDLIKTKEREESTRQIQEHLEGQE